MSESDPQFVAVLEKAQAGDHAAMNALLRPQDRHLTAYVGRRIQRGLARIVAPEDILQEVYLSTFRNIKRFSGDTKAGFRAWLFGIAENKLREARKAESAKKRGWEFMGHNQSNSRPLNQIPPETEKAVIQGTFDRIEQATGTRPRGWLGGGVIETWNTLDYLIDAGGQYVCDWVNDDQPYLMDVDGRRLVSVPYASETNDFGAFLRWGMTPDQFADQVRRQFDVLYRESAESGRVMALSLHPFLIGVAHRIGALETALEHICGHDDVWLATGGEIMDHYLDAGATF